MRKIATYVLAIHALLVLTLCFHHIFTRKSNHKPIIVKTISYIAPQPVKVSSTPTLPQAPVATKSSKPSPPKKQSKTVAKKSPPKKELPKDPVVTTPKVLAKPQLHIPIMKKPKEEIVPSTPIANDEELLIAFLQQTLELPEHGTVKVKMEIDAWGRVKRCEIIEAHSQKNSSFLQKELAHLQLPLKDFDRSITITFRNAH